MKTSPTIFRQSCQAFLVGGRGSVRAGYKNIIASLFILYSSISKHSSILSKRLQQIYFMMYPARTEPRPPRKRFAKQFENRKRQTRLTFRLACVLILMVLPLFGGAGCEKNAATGRTQFMMFSEKEEVALGQTSMEEFEAEFGGRIVNQGIQMRIQRIGNSMAEVSHRPDLPYTFYALDSEVPNAFSLPGGPVYITRGMLELLDYDDDLIAAVIGHEIGHITARHSVTQLQKAMGLNLLLLAISSGGDSRETKAASAAGQVVGTMVILKHGREDEYESDELGIQYLAAAGYDPDAMVGVMKKLMTLEQDDPGGLADLMRSHPHSSDRVKHAEDYIAKKRKKGKLPE